MSRRDAAPQWLGEVEALSAEICAELREVVEMLATYRALIGNAARLIARTADHPLIGDPTAAETARQLARVANIEAEIEDLLAPREIRDSAWR